MCKRRVVPVDNPLPRESVCFCEKSSKRCAKARASPRHRMPHGPLMERGVQKGDCHSAFQTPCEKLARLKNCAFLRFAQVSSFHDSSTATLDNERDDALFVLAVLVRYFRQGCGSVEVRACMACLHITWHARITLSQVVDEHCGSNTVQIYDRTSSGQLHLAVSRTPVQWFAVLCRVCCARVIARSTSRSVYAARGRCLCLFGASRLTVDG